MSQRRAVPRFAAPLLATLLLAGCSGGQVVAVDGTTAVIGSPTDEAMDALLIGTIVVEDGCWAIRGPNGVSNVYWPTGTVLDESGLRPPGVPAPLVEGDAVEAGGGEVDAGTLGAPADACWGEGEKVFSAWTVTATG